MPVVYRPAGSCGAVFDPPTRGIRGIPLQFFVRPVVRQGGVGQDIPKGFELPGCMVEQCCSYVLEFSRNAVVARLCSAPVVVYEVEITNLGNEPLTNLTMTPISLAVPGVPIASGDTEIVLPPTASLAAGATIVLTATTTYTLPAVTPVDYVIPIAIGALSSDQVNSLIDTGIAVSFCPAV